MDELDRRLGHQLVSRQSTGCRLTELGEELLSHAERVEHAADDFDRRVSAWGKEHSGTVKVTCPEGVAARLMRSGLMDKFAVRYPALRVEFVMSEAILNLGKGQADIAIRGASPTDNALIGRKIADAPWAIYARKSYVRRFGGVENPQDINRHTVNIFNGALGDHHSVKWIRSVAPDARIVARADNLAGLLMAAKSGSGLTPMPVIVGELESDLVRVLGPVPELAAPFYLLMHRDMKGTPRVRALFEFFAEELPAIRALLIGKTGPKSKLAKRSR